MSAHILSAGQCYIYGSPCFTILVTNKLLLLIYFVCLEPGKLHFFSKIMALLMSCISLLWEISYPCTSMKYLDHIMFATELSILITSPSVELFLFIFCLVDSMDINILSWNLCVFGSLHTPRTKCLPTIPPLTCHHRLRLFSVTLFP